MNAATQSLPSNFSHTSNLPNIVSLAGRILLAILFIGAGLQKITGFEGTVAYISGAGLPMAPLMAVGTLAIEIGAGIALIVGWQTRLAALALAGFTLAASVIFHNYWAVPEAQAYVQQLMFMKNVAIAGGLLVLTAHGAGSISLDARKS